MNQGRCFRHWHLGEQRRDRDNEDIDILDGYQRTDLGMSRRSDRSALIEKRLPSYKERESNVFRSCLSKLR